MSNNFIGIILAAGRGSRMLEETALKPKCMTKIDKKKTLLDMQINSLKKAGINKIYLITGYRHNKINYPEIKKIKNNEWKSSNMVYSLLYAKHLLSSYNCIISYSDIVYTSKTVINLIRKNKNYICISYDKKWKKLWTSRFKNPLDDAESFDINKKSEILDIGSKETDIKKIKGQFMGLIKTNPNDWRKIKKYINKFPKADIKKLQTTKLLNMLIKKNIVKVKGVKNVGKWCEIDSLNDLKIAKKIFKK